MGIFASTSRACRLLDKLAEHRIPKLGKDPKNKAVDHVAQFKKFQKYADKANKSFFVGKKTKFAINQKVTSLAYLLGAVRGGKDKEEAGDIDHIIAKAAQWKKKQIFFGKDNDLTDLDIQKLKDIASYKDYLPYVNWPRFFKWSLHHNLSIDMFVQFPPVVQKVTESYIESRAATFGGLEFVEKKGSKDVKLLIDGKLTSILNGKRKINFKSGLVTTVDKLFKSFANKNLVEGSYTYLKDEGIVPWDSFKIGYTDNYGHVDSVDLKQADWYQKLPMLEKGITKEEASERFGIDFDGNNWGVTLVCKRQSKNLDTYGSHSYLRLLIPNGDGTYDYTYGWGLFSKKYPQNFLHSLSFLFQPKKGTVQYPDNNEIYTSREMIEIHHEMTPENGLRCIKSMGRDIKKARKNKKVFQILIKNCSDSALKKIEKYAVDGAIKSHVIDIPYIDLNPKGVFGGIMKVLRLAPDWFRRAFLFTAALFLGGWKSMHEGNKKICVLDTPPWDLKRPFHHPGKAFL